MMSPLEISATALSAQRVRMNVIASNLANAQATRDEYGRNVPYKRLEVLFSPRQGNERDGTGVRVMGIQAAANPYRWVHNPDHPDAVEDPDSEHFGEVRMPRINAVREMVDMMLASRSYEANLTAMEVSKSLSDSVSRIIA